MVAERPNPELRRIHPPSADAQRIAARDAYADLDFAASAPPDRPYVVVNMVATADGQGRIGANTAELGDAADAALFATLRERVDCVMAGWRTISVERYSAPARGDEVRERRAAAGLKPRPIVSTLTRGGELATDAPLFNDPDLQVVVFSGRPVDLSGVAARAECVVTADPAEALRTLRADFGVRSLLLEGGPHLNTPFFAAGLVDELFLTLAPVLTGNADPFPIIAGALPERHRLELVGALDGDDHLFLRYRVA